MTIFQRRIKKEYGNEKIKGRKYRSLIAEVLARNNEKISSAVGRLTNENYKVSTRGLGKNKAKTIKLPELSKVIPQRSIHLIKGQDQSKLISETLRNQLQNDLRASLKKFDGTGEQRMEIQRGVSTGKINPKLIDDFQNRIQQTFQSRTKRDKKTGVPPKVKNIAVTEIRSTVGSIKRAYQEQVLKNNPDLISEKTWLHNRRLSKKPRVPHAEINGLTIPSKELFVVRNDKGGFNLMSAPHDPTAPAGQVIGCNCDIVYKFRLKQ
jgi:hypothetical protein